MSSRRHIKKSDDTTDINISPMIDMVFILLIFCIVTTVFVDEDGLGVDKPTPKPPEEQQEENDEPVIFKVTVQNQIVHKDNIVPLGRIPDIVKTALSQADVPVIMQVERGALAGTMVQVMDRVKVGGAQKVSVTAVD